MTGLGFWGPDTALTKTSASTVLSIGKVEFSSVVPMLPRSESRHSPDRQILRVDM
jgi:hypothetical protein